MTYKQFFLRLVFYIKPHIFKISITLISVILAGGLSSAVPEITGQIVDNIFGSIRNEDTAFLYAFYLLGIGILTATFTLIYTSSSAWVSNKVVMDIRNDMFSKILSLPKNYFDKNSTGKTISKLTFDVEQIAAAASIIWVDFFRSLVVILILTGYLFYKNWQLSIVLIALIPIVYITIKIAAKRMRIASSKVQQSMGDMTNTLDENISNNALIKLHNAQKSNLKKFNILSNKVRQQRFKVEMTNAFNSALVGITIVMSLSVVVYLSSIKLNMSAGDFLAFFTAMSILIKPVKQITSINKPLQLAIAAAESVFGIMDIPSEIDNGANKITNIKGDISFNNVSFSYGHKQTLKNINLDIKAGQTVALVGATGSGKSTIGQLLCRFYNLDNGYISIDGINIVDVSLEDLRNNIALVNQNINLFNDSIINNIALGGKCISQNDIAQIAKLSCIDDFVANLADSYDSQIGERGANLSGGQKQRLAIARAIAKNSTIIIFDEATSSLDNITERKIQKSIDSLRKDKTIIIIAHRLSTVQQADKIIVLKDGCIVEEGKHSDLLALNKEYAGLYNNHFD